jgi:hypothetical protein
MNLMHLSCLLISYWKQFSVYSEVTVLHIKREEYIYRTLVPNPNCATCPTRFISLEFTILIIISERKITKLQVFNAFTIKNFVRWNLMPCIFVETSVSGKYTASFFKLEEGSPFSFETLIFISYQTTWCHT